ncbi:MAG: hypothetical protein R6W90_16320 [Ignavibacteriaceae bacterium]
MLSLSDKWIWDFWFAKNGNDTHIFYLQAPKSLLHEQYRHTNATIGHAVSQDLINWNILPDALIPGLNGEWDDLATWTGSIIRHKSLWYMFYTGVNRAEKGLIQRIGLAISDNLLTWKKHPANPLIEADALYYELLDSNSWKDQAWRDPWVFKHDEKFHAYITARVNYGPPDGRGVIAHTESNDLVKWNVLPPVTEPGEFGELEVPQLLSFNNTHYLLFNTYAVSHSQQRLNRSKIVAVTGVHYLAADNPLGPFKLITDKFILGDKAGTLYSGKMIQTNEGEWRMMACRSFSGDGEFEGVITDPFKVDFY